MFLMSIKCKCIFFVNKCIPTVHRRNIPMIVTSIDKIIFIKKFIFYHIFLFFFSKFYLKADLEMKFIILELNYVK